MHKRWLLFALVFMMAFAFSGCGDKSKLDQEKVKELESFNPNEAQEHIKAVGKAIQFDNGSTYIGEVNAEGKPHGQGKFETIDPYTVYIGGFENGLRSGIGYYETPAGVAKGFFSGGNLNGYAIVDSEYGVRFIGELVENQAHGEGEKYQDGELIEAGRYENNELVEPREIKQSGSTGNTGGIVGFFKDALSSLKLILGVVLGIGIYMILNRMFTIVHFGMKGVISFLIGCMVAGYYIVGFVFGF